ncbi:copper homeostasis CutC domain-containing protein [Mycena filopes]|nr:copper homeostasis CutC domain-containing protein [Mycena filopes]
MVMIRPRTGDFLYSEDEIEVMLDDIRVFKEHNVSGLVLGALKADGRVDIDVSKRLVDEALPLQVCFHRAFDMTRDPAQALADVMNIGGVSRILTSGHAQTALEGLDTLEAMCAKTQQLSKELPWVLNILPGSGINSDTVGVLLDALLPQGVMELHLSGGGWEESEMAHRKAGLGMGVGASEWGVWVTSEAKVRAVRRFADAVWAEYCGQTESVNRAEVLV